MLDQRDVNTTHPSTTNSTGAGPSWILARLLDDIENVDTGIFDNDDSDQVD
jgi:hypothetical protein